MLKELLIHLTLFLGSKQDHHHTFFRLFFPLVIVRECFRRLSGNPKSFFWSPPPFKGRHSPPVESRILIPSPTYQPNRSLPATRKTNKLRTRAARGRPDHPVPVSPSPSPSPILSHTHRRGRSSPFVFLAHRPFVQTVPA